MERDLEAGKGAGDGAEVVLLDGGMGQAVERVPWSVSLMQILWTAGPVTLIGAWGGYLLGYGKEPTFENYIFFISYTVITGVAGIVANIAHNLTSSRRYDRTEAKIERVIDTVPELILATRNLIVESLEGDARRREAAAMLLRKQDRLSLMELHPADYATLHAAFDGDYQVRATHLDGWLALAGHLPPKERRGIVLVDPPFEEPGEFDRLADGLAKAHRRFATGTYLLWYPIKTGAPVAAFHQKLKELAIPKILCAELVVRSERDAEGLAGSGLVIVNPPYTLAGELDILLPYLKTCLAQDRFARAGSFWIAGETAHEKEDGR